MSTNINDKSILFLITKSEIGGAQRFVQDQIKILRESNFRIFLCTNQEGWLIDSVRDYINGYVTEKAIESRFSVSFIIFLFKFLHRNNIDLVICNSANAGLYGRLVSLICKTKSIYVSHGWSSVYNGGKLSFIFNLIERVLATVGNSVLCVSLQDRNVALQKINIPKNRIHVIPNSVFPSSKVSCLKEVEVLKVIMVCRMEYPKRPDLIIEAVGQMGPSVELTLIGKGYSLDKVLAIEKKLPTNIKIIGEIPEFKNYEEYDVFALISDSEGLPISALEAMSSGLALILSNVGGCYSLIQGNGILVENSVASIVDGLNEISAKLLDFKKASQSLFSQNFNLKNNRKLYLDYYTSFLS